MNLLPYLICECRKTSWQLEFPCESCEKELEIDYLNDQKDKENEIN
tara:strand:- start:1329 stop:1466 length:138 start_codon:yes stop_codon:yes gene_type:complete